MVVDKQCFLWGTNWGYKYVICWGFRSLRHLPAYCFLCFSSKTGGEGSTSLDPFCKNIFLYDFKNWTSINISVVQEKLTGVIMKTVQNCRFRASSYLIRAHIFPVWACLTIQPQSCNATIRVDVKANMSPGSPVVYGMVVVPSVLIPCMELRHWNQHFPVLFIRVLKLFHASGW